VRIVLWVLRLGDFEGSVNRGRTLREIEVFCIEDIEGDHLEGDGRVWDCVEVDGVSRLLGALG